MKGIISFFLFISCMEAKQNVLIVGNGAREHALAWKTAQSSQVEKIWVAPGNGGTAIEKGVANVAIPPDDINALVTFAEKNHIDLVLVGPEISLAAGIVNACSEKGIRCFGPTLQAAQLETSKQFAKEFMNRHSIPTAQYAQFTQVDEAIEYVNQHSLPLVIKADGLASGKGVVIAQTKEEAIDALEQMMVQKIFGRSGERTIIEEYLEGEEISFIVVTDGEHVLPLALSQDHKKLYDHDKGPNTGGMGAYSPVSIVTPEMENEILQTMVIPTVQGMREEGIPYAGFLYVGIMLTKEGAKVLEYNCRLGDPEASPLLVRLQSDLVEMCQAALDHRLDQIDLNWDQRKAVAVVLASHGYPNSSSSEEIIDMPINEGSDYKIFHAHTKYQMGDLIATGGRVLCVTALGSTTQQAAQRAYELIQSINWPGAHFRTDIGYRECQREKNNQSTFWSSEIKSRGRDE